MVSVGAGAASVVDGRGRGRGVSVSRSEGLVVKVWLGMAPGIGGRRATGQRGRATRAGTRGDVRAIPAACCRRTTAELAPAIRNARAVVADGRAPGPPYSNTMRSTRCQAGESVRGSLGPPTGASGAVPSRSSPSLPPRPVTSMV